MASQETCIVGEAFGGSPAYWNQCAECRSFSIQFARHFGGRSYMELKGEVNRFVDHWNEKHTGVRKNGRGLRWFDSLLRFDCHIRILQ
jgi:hypothetical protein